MHRRAATRFLILLIGVLAAACACPAAASWVELASDSPAGPVITVAPTATGTERVEILGAGFVAEPVAIDGAQYLRLRVPGRMFTLERGAPEVPLASVRLRIPDAGDPAVRVVESVWRDAGDVPPVPSKGNLLRDIDPAQVAWTVGEAYRSNEIHPAREAELGRPFIVRDVRGVVLRVPLLRWDAGQRRLLALEKLVVEVATTGSGGVNEKVRPESAASDAAFATLYERGFDNWRDLEKYARIEADGPLLIVAPASLADAVAPLVDWKRQRGLPTELITLESVGGTAAGIQAAVQERYFSNAGLTYLVLVGDLEQMPTNLGDYEGAHDDTRYGRVEGDDAYPDLFVSRISARTADEVAVQVAKFVGYERNPDAAGDWYARAAGIASDQGTPTDAVRAARLRDKLLTYTFTEVDEIYAPTGWTEDIAAALNEGRSLVNYLGHGTGAQWTSPYFHTDDVHALENGWKLPWILDVSCSNGDFERIECFAEAWLRAGTPEEPAGAVAIYSASTVTPWVPPTVMQAEAVDLLVTDRAQVVGALYTHGMLEVLDVYPGDEGLQLVEQYNIFGDCSLVVRTDRPLEIVASHPDALDAGAAAYPVETGLADATAALYRGGELLATGRTDPTGSVLLAADAPFAMGDPVTLTVTAYNRVPYVTELPVETAQAFAVEPAAIPVGQTTNVTVRLLNQSAAGVEVGINGLGVEGLAVTTDAAGVAVFEVTPRFGETLRVAGRQPGALFDLFTGEVQVTGALDLPGAALGAVTPVVGTPDTLAVNLPGEFTGSAAAAGLTLALEYFDTREVFAADGTEVTGSLTPPWPGTVLATLAQDGCNVFRREFEVIQPMASLDGSVVDADDGDAPLHNALIRGFLAGSDPAGPPVFEVYSEFGGTWAAPAELAIGNYDIYVEKLGYHDFLQTITLLPSTGPVRLGLTQTPRGSLSGVVMDAATSTGLYTLVEVFRADTGAKVAQTWSIGAEGQYTLTDLPYFEYDILVSPDRYTPSRKRIVIDALSQELHFSMDATVGSILVLSDYMMSAEERATAVHDARLDKAGGVVQSAYEAPVSRAALDLIMDLTPLGYTVDYSPLAGSDPSTWMGYGMLVVSFGDQPAMISEETKAALREYTANHRPLLIEGGDVAWTHASDGAFARDVLHIDGWVSDEPGDVGVYQALHPVMGYPNPLPPSIEMTSAGSGSADAVSAASSAVVAGSWTGSWSDGSVVCYGPEELQGAGLGVFFSFDYTALDPEYRRDLLHNAVHWLIEPRAGRAFVSGRVDLLGQTDNSGVLLTLTPGGRICKTDAAGLYEFDFLYSGTYTLTATKPGWSTHVRTFSVSQEAVITDLDFELTDAVEVEYWSGRLSSGEIPDNDPEGLVDGIECLSLGIVSGIEVFLDVTHPYLADLVIDLTSPEGTTVRLHQNNGGDGDNILGWYPTELPAYGVLQNFVGGKMLGQWQLRVADVGPWDEGVLNEWGLRFTYAPAAATPEQTPSALTLEGNHPNPFNPSTTIAYALPNAGNVDLAVFDVAGRRVAVLAGGHREAGRHEAVWNGRDAAGRAVASGTYFYRLRTADGSRTGKMLLAK